MLARRKPVAGRVARPRGVRPVDASSLAVVRIALGAIGLLSAVRMVAYGWIDSLYAGPTRRFTYLGFAWVPQPTHLADPRCSWRRSPSPRSGWCSAGAPGCRPWPSSSPSPGSSSIDATTYLNHYWFLTLAAGARGRRPDGTGAEPRRPPRRWACDRRGRLGVAPAVPGGGGLRLRRASPSCSSDWLVRARSRCGCGSPPAPGCRGSGGWRSSTPSRMRSRSPAPPSTASSCRSCCGVVRGGRRGWCWWRSICAPGRCSRSVCSPG